MTHDRRVASEAWWTIVGAMIALPGFVIRLGERVRGLAERWT